MSFLGFFQAPSAVAPGTPSTGDCYFDTGLNQPMWWDGAAWVAAVTGGGGGAVVFNDSVPGANSNIQVDRATYPQTTEAAATGAVCLGSDSSGSGTAGVQASYATISGGDRNLIPSSGTGAIVLGGESNQANRSYSIVGGQGCITEGAWAVALGDTCQAGNFGFANHAFASGDHCNAYAEGSTAFGVRSNCNGSAIGSFCVGVDSTCNGRAAAAFGENANAVQDGQLALGSGTAVYQGSFLVQRGKIPTGAGGQIILSNGAFFATFNCQDDHAYQFDVQTTLYSPDTNQVACINQKVAVRCIAGVASIEGVPSAQEAFGATPGWTVDLQVSGISFQIQVTNGPTTNAINATATLRITETSMIA